MKNKIVKLQSLNINFDDLLKLLYHQTGIQTKYFWQTSNSHSLFTTYFVARISNVVFEVERIFENEENYPTSMLSVKNEHRADSVTMLRIFIKNNINFVYLPNKEDLDILDSHSRQLCEWIMENKLANKRKTLTEKTCKK